MHDPATTPRTVTVPADRVVRVVFFTWLAIEVFFVVIDTVVNYNRLTEVSQFRRMANIAREDGLATWFSSMQLLLVSMVAALATLRVHMDRARWRTLAWALVALFFFYLAFDDGAKVHERVATGVKKLLATDGRSRHEVFDFFPSYAWQLIFGPVFVGMGLFMAGFFWKELRHLKLRFMVLAALACWAFAVGLDFIEGLEQEYDDVAAWLDVTPKWASHYGRVLEEFLEMFGTTLFLTAFLRHLLETCGPLDLRFRQRSD